MERGVRCFLLVFSLVLLLVFPFASASFFGEVFGKITGHSSYSPDSVDGPISYEQDYFGADWTQWFDRDGPGGMGDYEDLKSLRLAYPSEICENPVEIECQTVGGSDYTQTGEVAVCSLENGFYCVNSEQPDRICNYDYKVRFNCGEIVEKTSFCEAGECRLYEGSFAYFEGEKLFISQIGTSGVAIQIGEGESATMTSILNYVGESSITSDDYKVTLLELSFSTKEGVVSNVRIKINKVEEGFSCSDGIKNGDELGVDCGGSCVECLEERRCVDGDGGSEFISGSIIKGKTLTDLDYSGKTDFCFTSNSSILFEFYCDVDGYVKSKTFVCENGCLNGACLKDDNSIYVAQKCLDVDIRAVKVEKVYGTTYNVTLKRNSQGDGEYGSKVVFVNDTEKISSEVDSGIILSSLERGSFYTNPGIVANKLQVIPYFVDDAGNEILCAKSFEFEFGESLEFYGSLCSDSDGGSNPFVKGSVNLGNGSNIIEDVCSAQGTNVFEYSCVNGGVVSDFIYCQNGCSDGACIGYNNSGVGDAFCYEKVELSEGVFTGKCGVGEKLGEEFTIQFVGEEEIFLQMINGDLILLTKDKPFYKYVYDNQDELIIIWKETINNRAELASIRSVSSKNWEESLLEDEFSFRTYFVSFSNPWISEKGDSVLITDGIQEKLLKEGEFWIEESDNVKITIEAILPGVGMIYRVELEENSCDAGCFLDGKCYAFGFVKEKEFCSEEYGFIGQFSDGSSCENGFECLSGVCVEGECISNSVWEKFIGWFTNIFRRTAKN